METRVKVCVEEAKEWCSCLIFRMQGRITIQTDLYIAKYISGKLVSSVSIVSMWAGILTIWESFSARGNFFLSLSHSVQSDCEAPTAHTGVRDGLFLGIKQFERDMDHLFARGTKDRNAFLYTLIP